MSYELSLEFYRAMTAGESFTFASNGSTAAMLFQEGSRFWIQRVLVPIVVLVGVTGNFVTMVVLTRRRMTSSTNTYLTALAVADLLYLLGLMYLSFENYPSISHVDYMWYWKSWRYALWFTDATTGTSVWLTVSFTIERYIAVCHPLRGKIVCTESRARKVIVCVFLICFLSTVTTPFEWNISLQNNGTKVEPEPSSLGSNATYRTLYYWFCVIAFVFLPLILIAIFNTFLINAVHRSRNQRRGLTQQVEQCGNSSRQKQENKITMTLIAVVILFLVCQTPTACMLIVMIFYNPPRFTQGDFILRGLGNIFNFLVAVNAASNFLLYCAMSDKYRRTLMITFLPCLTSKHQRSHTFTSYNASHHNSSVRFNNIVSAAD